MFVDGEHYNGIDRRIINENNGNMQIYGQGHNCQITIAGPLFPRNRHKMSLNTSHPMQNRGTAVGDAEAGYYEGPNNAIINNNTGTMTIVGQGTNSRVHLGYASSFSHDTETQNVSSTPQSPPAGAPSHLIHRDILCQNSKVSMTFDHLDAVSPNLSGETATPYMVNQTMDQRDVPVGPSLLPYQVPAYYHDSQDFMNAGAPSTAASLMNKMVALAESDLLGSLSARTAVQHRAIDAGPSLLPVAPIPLSVPHARGLALTPTPPPFPISPTPSQSMVLSPAPTTAPTPPPFIQNPNLIAVPVPSTVPSPTKTLDVYPSRQPKPLQYIPITRVPAHPTHIANPDGMRRGEQSTAASASTEVSIREPAACYGTTLSAPPAPNTVANQASPSPVAKIVQTFHPTQSPPLNVNTSSPTCSTSSEAAGSLLLKVQEILEKLNLGPLTGLYGCTSKAQTVNQAAVPDAFSRMEVTTEGLRVTDTTKLGKKKKYCALIS